MAFTLTQLIAAASHAAGKATFDSGNSPTICANLALDRIVNFAPWSWRHKTANLNTVGGQSYVALPADFDSLVYLRGGASRNTVLTPTSYDRILQMRQYPTANGGAVTFHAVAQADQSGANPSTYQLELFPTPSSSVTAAFAVQYLRQVAALSAGSDVANVPAQMQSLLFMLTRGYARLTEDGTVTEEMTFALNDLEARRVRDGMTQPVAGRVHGTVEDNYRGDYDRGDRFATDDVVTV